MDDTSEVQVRRFVDTSNSVGKLSDTVRYRGPREDGRGDIDLLIEVDGPRETETYCNHVRCVTSAQLERILSCRRK
jgi:hypothetical protein